MRKLLSMVMLLALSTLFALAPCAQVRADDGSILGTWIVTTTPNLPPGVPALVYTELVSFNGDGTLVDTHAIAHGSELPFLPAVVAVDSSDAFGIWRPVGWSRFQTIHKRLLFAGPNTPSALYGPAAQGQQVGFETVQTMLTLEIGANGETLTGPFTVQFTNLNGQVVFADTGTVSFQRLKFED